MKHVLMIALLLFIRISLFSQDNKTVYKKVDDIVLKLPAFGSESIDSLASLLTGNFSSENQKVRAVYAWVAGNIAYNVPKYEERRNAMNVIRKKKDESESADKIMNTRKAICEGYSNLVKALCNASGINCETIEGIGRPVNNQYDLHAWNAVVIDGEWQLLDATWSAGGIDTRKNTFEKKFDDTFFLMSPSEFIKTHYPFDPMWQLMEKPVSKKEFEASKTYSDDTAFFNFKDTIKAYFQQDSIQRLMASNARTFQFDPGNKLAEQNLNNVSNYRENEKMNNATLIFQQAVSQYNECTAIINEAKQTRITKKMDASEMKLKQLLNNSRNNTNKAIALYQTVKFTEHSNAFILKQNIENGKNNLKQLDQLDKYLEKYFSTPEIKRKYVL